MTTGRVAAAVRAHLWPVVAAACGVFAYRSLLASEVRVPGPREIEGWLFRPSGLPPLAAVAVAGWLVWRRRGRLLALPTARHRGATAAIGLAGAALFLWGVLTRSSDPLLLSLALHALAFGCAARGLPGARALLLPALVILLGVRIPAPLLNEIVWGLQRATATGAAALLDAVGLDVVHEGVILRSAKHSFQVIDGCSGLQGITTLVIVAILVGELLSLPVRRRCVLVAIAPLFGYVLNVVRIAYIAASPDPDAYAGLEGSHTVQGVALLALGTAMVYGTGWTLASGGRAEHALPLAHAAPQLPGQATAIALAALAAVSAVLAPFEPPAVVTRAAQIPDARGTWTSQPLQGDAFFLGTAPAGTRLFRRYQRGATPGLIDTIDVLIVYESEHDGASTSHLLSSKSEWPGPNWNLLSRRRVRLWDLSRDAALAVAAHTTGPERAVVLQWRIRDQGPIRESLRSLLALDASPLRRGSPRAVVQLVAYSPWADDPVALERARARLDRFIALFRSDLEAL